MSTLNTTIPSLYDHSHTDESKAARVSPAMHPKIFFTPDALPATTIPIFRLGDWLRICRLG